MGPYLPKNVIVIGKFGEYYCVWAKLYWSIHVFAVKGLE